jgi:hypothetical protein
MISQIVLDSDEFQQAFCEGCPAVSVIRGARDSLGVPQDPDEWECPADFCPWDEKCFRYQTFEEIEKLLCQVDTFLAEAGSYV